MDGRTVGRDGRTDSLAFLGASTEGLIMSSGIVVITFNLAVISEPTFSALAGGDVDLASVGGHGPHWV